MKVGPHPATLWVLTLAACRYNYEEDEKFMYIHSFRVKNYLIHQDTSLDLEPLTVLVGPNGAGKSALFDAMINFSLLSRGNIRQAFGPYPFSFRSTIYRGASAVARVGYTVEMSQLKDDAVRLKYEIDYAQQGVVTEDHTHFMIFNERLTKLPSNEVVFDRSNADDFSLSSQVQLDIDRSIFSAIRLSALHKSMENLDPLLQYFTQQISRFNKFRLDPFVLAQPSRLPDVTTAGDETHGYVPRIGYHGEDLAATLYYLSETNAPEMNDIIQSVRTVDPDFAAFEFSTVGPDRIAFNVVYSDQRQAVPSVRLSSGMLIYIGLLALVSTPSRPPVLMIEEPENGLTPQAIKAFYQAVRNLAFHPDKVLGSQILLSSHSPFVICEAWNGEDRKFIKQVKVTDGKSKIRPFEQVVKDLGLQLQKDCDGVRTVLSIRNAEQIMAGYLA